MTSCLSTFFGLLSIVTALVGCKGEKNTPGMNEPIVVATSADYPPFEFYKNGEMVGFEIDLIKAIAFELKREVKFQDLPFDSIIGSLQAKRVDLAISAISATEERAKVVDFSTHYNESKTVLITDDLTINDMNDLKEKTVGVQMGSTYEPCMKEWQTKIQGLQVQSLTKVPDLIQNLKVKRIVGIVLGVTEATAIMEQVKGFKMIVVPETEISYAIALPKGSEFTAKINEIIEKMKKDGSLKTLQDKWLKG
ncbi:MAG: ABC transporter substrate-binding protein [Candidatus Paracaedibacteraceae bacterium]|nr:ABC transporter substrate-binding protein [Candidatus Paracaedibacteraceae bacterium]